LAQRIWIRRKRFDHKEDTMEFLVEFQLTIPQDADPAEVDARKQAETAASAELARAG